MGHFVEVCNRKGGLKVNAEKTKVAVFQNLKTLDVF